MSTEKPKGFWKQLAQVIKDEFETSAIGFEVNSHIANAKMSNERRQEGRDARSASLQMDNNPYTDKTDRKDWDQGWNEEDQRLVAEKLLEEKIAVEKKANEQQICRDQGGAARALSQPRKSNPFKDSDANAAWNAGWDEEHEKACRNEGSEARKQGIARSENPHFDHVSNSAWEKGWSASHLSCSITEGQQARLSGIPESSNPHSDPVGNPGWLKGWKKEAKTSILRSQAEGVKARSSGLSIECNPYSIHDDRVSWERGWEEENKARLNAEVVVRKQRNLENGGCINCGGKLTNGMPCFACGTSWAVNRLEADEWRRAQIAVEVQKAAPENITPPWSRPTSLPVQTPQVAAQPTIFKISGGNFKVLESTSSHIRISNVRSKDLQDKFGNTVIRISFEVYYFTRRNGDMGGGVSLGYDVFNSDGVKVDSAMVFMPQLSLGEKGLAEIEIPLRLVGASFFGRFSVVV